MKQFIISSAIVVYALLAGAAPARAQADAPAVRWGVRVSADLNIPGDWFSQNGSANMFNAGPGFTAGAVCHINTGHNFFIEPGVSFFYDRYSYKDDVLADVDGHIFDGPSLYKLGVRVPVIGGLCFNITPRFAIELYTGPELSYAFGGDVNLKGQTFEESLALFGPDGNQRRLDCAWKVGAGIPAGDWNFTIDVAYGFVNLLKTGLSFHENRCNISVTRYF